MCVITAISAGIGLTAAIASSIATAATAVGTGLAAVGIGTGISAGTAATIGTVGAAGLIGAAQGAAYGAGISAITGGDVGNSALMGGLTGGVLGGAGAVLEVMGGIDIPGTDINIGGGDNALYNQTYDSLIADGVVDTNATANAVEQGVMSAADAQMSSEVSQLMAGNSVNGLELGQTITTADGSMLTDADLGIQGAGAAGTVESAIADTTAGTKAGAGAATGTEKSILSDLTWKDGLKAGAMGASAVSTILQSQSIQAEADATAALLRAEGQNALDIAKQKAVLQEEEAGVFEMASENDELEARMHRLRAANEEKAAGYEKEGVLKQKKQLVGKGRVAAAANGVLLEGRAESSPAMWEQDASAEAAYEIGKISMNTRMKQQIHMANAAIATGNSYMNKARAAMTRYGAASTRYGGAMQYRLNEFKAQQTLSNASLKSTSNYISGLANMASTGVSLFA